jgi:hypothetical protein
LRLACDYVKGIFSPTSQPVPYRGEAKLQNGKAAEAAAPVYPFNPSSFTTSTRFLRGWELPPKFSTRDLGMSTTGQTASPSRTDDFKAIFQTATREYERVMGKPLDMHPFSKQLDSCDSPEAVSNVLRTQAQAFSKFREGDEKLRAWLDLTVNLLFTFSATLGEAIGLVIVFFPYCCPLTSHFQPFSPAKTIFTGISLLLAVCLHPKSPVAHMLNARTTGSKGCRGRPQYAHLPL